MHILLIEDDALLGDGIQAGLQAMGFTVAWVTRAREGLAAWKSVEFDGQAVCSGRTGGAFAGTAAP